MDENRPATNKEQLLDKISQVSFAVYDMTLYLDTHPKDQDGIEYVRKYTKLRKQYLEEYAKCYGPLSLDCTDESDTQKWQWVLQPWPWENQRRCR